MNYDRILQEIYQEIQPYAHQGEPAAYIPDLLKVDPDRYGICLHTLDGHEHALGDSDERFAIQSISKVFALAMGFARLSDRLWQRIGVEPSGNAFNSIFQLELEHGIPRNPLINAGALVMTTFFSLHWSIPNVNTWPLYEAFADATPSSMTKAWPPRNATTAT